MAKTRRKFTPKFKREAVALLESGGQPQMQVAAELRIQPFMLRQWRTTLNGTASQPRPRASSPSVPASPVTSSSDQAAEIARLRRELDRTGIERDVSKKPSASSPRCRGEVLLHRAACPHLAGGSHVPRVPGFPERLLRMAVASRECPVGCKSSATGGCSPHPCR